MLCFDLKTCNFYIPAKPALSAIIIKLRFKSLHGQFNLDKCITVGRKSSCGDGGSALLAALGLAVAFARKKD